MNCYFNNNTNNNDNDTYNSYHRHSMGEQNECVAKSNYILRNQGNLRH